MARTSKKQQTYSAVEAMLLATCKLHKDAAACLRDLPETHGNSDVYGTLSDLVDSLSEHVEEVGASASVVDTGLTRVVIAHFKEMAAIAEFVPAPAMVASLPSADLEVPEFDLSDGTTSDAEVGDE